jgi:hypothetical protein
MPPAALTLGFTFLAAVRSGTESLPDTAAIVGLEILVAVLTLTLSNVSPHWPSNLLLANDRGKSEFKEGNLIEEKLNKKKKLKKKKYNSL